MWQGQSREIARNGEQHFPSDSVCSGLTAHQFVLMATLPDDDRPVAASAARRWLRRVLTHQQVGNFVLGGLATVTAVLFTNPIEVTHSLPLISLPLEDFNLRVCSNSFFR